MNKLAVALAMINTAYVFAFVLWLTTKLLIHG
jgi:hypothetical protein